MSDSWRKRCPEGHCTWEYRGSKGYYCAYCDEHFPKLVDWKTKQPVTLDV